MWLFPIQPNRCVFSNYLLIDSINRKEANIRDSYRILSLCFLSVRVTMFLSSRQTNMRRNRKLIAQAASLSSADLDRLLRSSPSPLPDHYRLEIHRGNELTRAHEEQIVHLFEMNMKSFYEQSSTGYHPEEKRQELFADASRHLLILSAGDLLAFVHFRFDLDYGSRVLYLYELQVDQQCQGQGLGQWCIEQLKVFCRATQMEKIVLTVHQTNQRAVDFYRKKCHFGLDSTDPGDETVDYFILSLSVWNLVAWLRMCSKRTSRMKRIVQWWLFIAFTRELVTIAQHKHILSSYLSISTI